MLIMMCWKLRELLNHNALDIISECMVVPDDWSVVHTRFIVDHPHGIFRRGVFVGGEIYKGYVICVSSKFSDSASLVNILQLSSFVDHRLLLCIRGIHTSNVSLLSFMPSTVPTT